ncbi:uncharacterized protein LOC134248384 [Saccostrea cucullata]|uniref:uncharacterized protein LOC134248384 n=1 Tax=Saccostrea cuccullata TaxID=36930 RepID=UPI002ED25E75
MGKVENLLSKQSGGLYDNETRLPRILIVYGGKLHALRKVISALASSIPVLIIKGSGGVADILVQIKVLRDDFYVARSVHVFEQDDTEDARKMIETLKVRKSLIERLWITDIEEFESNVVRIAFWGTFDLLDV